ncbi:MAG: hypothetical protein ACLUI3_05025 [Christensenellales bacterium]
MRNYQMRNRMIQLGIRRPKVRSTLLMTVTSSRSRFRPTSAAEAGHSSSAQRRRWRSMFATTPSESCWTRGDTSMPTGISASTTLHM